MTDQETLFRYRWAEAEETLAEAVRMHEEGFSGRSVVNRSYYAMFYGLLALFLRSGLEVKTSKHTGVIAMFDREFVLTGKVLPRFSKMLHHLFEERQKADYRELVKILPEDAARAVEQAGEFLSALRGVMGIDLKELK